MRRLINWMRSLFDIRLDFTGDLMAFDCPDDAGDPHYRKPYIVTPQQHAARLKGRR